ncbi:MAG: heavy metal translocating P-type ATPase [Oscillospiraceae bacterium]
MEHNHEHACACEKGHKEHEHEHEHDTDSSCGGDGCGCGNTHSHDKPASKKDIYLLVASVLIFAVTFAPIPPILKIILFALSALLAGYDLFFNGLKELISFKLEENALLLIAVVASFVLLEFPEACVVTILFKLGSFLESNAISRSKKSMESLTKIRPDYAYIKNSSGEFVSVKAESVAIGDTVYLRAGDKVALDSQIIEGNSSIDSSALTGESLPQFVNVGDELMSGSINLSGLLTCKVTKTFANSTASQIIDLVYASSKKKGKAENFISRFAKIYTPIVIILAIIIAVVPPLLSLGTFSDFIMRALIFLVASCPCSLVISIPLSFFSAIGASSKLGVLVKGSMYIEKLAKVDALCLDKTGTITSGKLTVDEVISTSSYSKEEIIAITASIESNSTHPIALSIVNSAGNYNKTEFTELSEIAGLGLSAKLGDKNFLCGGKNLLDANEIALSNLPIASVYLCENKIIIGYITIKEEISSDSLTLVSDMAKQNVNRVVMLTGDNNKSAELVAQKCGISEFYAALLPVDKVKQVERLKSEGNTVLFVGDGINDAPVLASADLGISMGLGSEIANVSSDIILASNRLSTLPKAIWLARRSMNIVRFNIAFALLVKLIVLVLGATGFGSMWLAVFADIGVTILSVLNSIRILGFIKK